MPPRGSFDALWYLDKTKLHPEAEAILREVDDFLVSERKGLNVPDPEVEEAVAAIADDADPEVLRLRDGLTGTIRASAFTWRQMSAGNCHRYDRRRTRDIKLGPNRTKTVTAKEEHSINRWIRARTDGVVMALIRENPQWLRNAAVADRVCKWRIDLTVGDDLLAKEAGRKFLEQLAGGGHGRRGHPKVGPRYPASDLWNAVLSVEARNRAERTVWLRVREEPDVRPTLLSLGKVFWQRVHGWDDADRIRVLGRDLDLTDDQAAMHLGAFLVIVRDTKNERWVTIDDEGWPRAAAIALLSARWDVSKGWLLKQKPQDGRENPL